MKKRGFSLVELLIVVSIMAILAGGLYLSMSGSTEKARATKLIADLQSLRTAGIMYESEQAGGELDGQVPQMEKLAEYTTCSLDGTKYAFYPASGTKTDHWYVGKIGLTAGSDLTKQLQKQAANAGLLAGESGEPSGDYAGGTKVWLKVR